LREAAIRVFGVGLLAFAAMASAALLWKRRQEELLAYYGDESGGSRLEGLRRAGL